MKKKSIEKKKKVIVIGGGLSGLTCAIYLLDQGFHVVVYEKNAVAGGECTGWARKGQYIDGCAHWICGTNPKSELFPIYKHIGAFDESTKVYPEDSLGSYALEDGRVFRFYSNLEKLENEMLSFFPEDKKEIEGFIAAAKAYQHVRIPAKKPVDKMNLFELTSFGLSMLPMALPFAAYRKISMEDYVKRFKSKELGNILLRYLPKEYNVHSLFYLLQEASKDDSGMVEGGSLAMMQRVKNTFVSRGGELHLASPVKEIYVENGTARGVILKNGEIDTADDVVSSADIHFTMEHLLKGKYPDRYFEKRFENRGTYPLISAMMVSLRYRGDLSSKDKMMDFLLKEKIPHIASSPDHYAIRNFAFDPSLKNGEYTLLTVLILTNDEDYDSFKAMGKEAYRTAKQDIMSFFERRIASDWGLDSTCLEAIDLTTPLTYERYCSAYRGSYMSFLTTAKSKGLMRNSPYPGPKHFYVTGQWLMSPGGLPIAIFEGKHTAYRLTLAEGYSFQNKEKGPVVPLLHPNPIAG